MNREVRLFDELDRFAAGREITHAMALSFGYDGDVANERIWRPLVEKYGVRHPLVIAGGAVDAGTALGVTVLRARRTSGAFHPKLFLAIREDAVLAAVGSANLTRGGLGANLELLTPLVFSKDAERPATRTLLEAILAFVGGHVLDGLQTVAESSREVVRDLLHHARLVADTLPERSRGPEIRFLHSYKEPLWNQLRGLHADDPVEHLLVISPFFELEKDGLKLDESDSLFRYALADGLPWSPRAKAPRCSLYVGPLEHRMPLPVGALVELHPQLISIEPRRLHAKLIVIFGRKRTTLLWGSPNFSPAAMLRVVSSGGNVECALAMTVSAASAAPEQLHRELDLEQTFRTHHGPLPDVPSRAPQAKPVFDVGEAVYEPATRNLTVFGECFSAAASMLRVLLVADATPVALIEQSLGGEGIFQVGAQCSAIEEEDPETGKRRLRSSKLRIEALDASGAVLESLSVRLNVQFEDALELHHNLLLGTGALCADALLVPSSAPPEQRVAALDAHIALLKEARRSTRVTPTRHQASLDLFFRNVRLGLDARWTGLERRRGSRFTLLRWSHDLRRALQAAAESTIDGSRRVYLVTRVAEHVERVLQAIPNWHSSPADAQAVLEPAKLAEALEAVRLEGTLHVDTLAEAHSTQQRVVAMMRRLA